MQKRLEELPKLAEEAKKENKKYFVNLRKRTPKNLDYLMQELHDKEFLGHRLQLWLALEGL